MREDMFKVIVERPRWGAGHAPRPKLRKDKYPGRKKVGLRRFAKEQGYTKHLNENLAPLKRYLNKQVGRKWDQVFSEICQHLDTGSTVKMHVREHIDDFIVTKVSIDRKGQWIAAGHRWGSYCDPAGWWQELYVDPFDGIIKRVDDLCRKRGEIRQKDRWKQRRKKSPVRHLIRKRSEKDYFVKLGGLWYSVTLDTSPRAPNIDIFHELDTGNWRQHERWKVVSKFQLGKKALREHGLQNSGENREAEK